VEKSVIFQVYERIYLVKNYLTILISLLVLASVLSLGCRPGAEVKTDLASSATKPDAQVAQAPAKAPEQPAQVKEAVTEKPAEQPKKPVEKPAVEQAVEAVTKTPPQADSLLVTIDGVGIYESEILKMLKPQLDRFAAQKPPPIPEQLKEYKQHLITGSLDGIITERVLDKKIKESNIVVTDKEVDAKILEMASSQQPPLSIEEFKALIESHGQTFEQVRNDVKKTACYHKLFATKWSNGEDNVTEQEAQNYYNDSNYAHMFKIPEKVRVSHILIIPDTSNPNTDPNKAKAAAKAKAEKLLKQIKAGADFAELAKQYSGCPSSAKGGDLGLITRDDMPPLFSEAAFKLKVGQISDIVETDNGYHIIKVTEHKEPRTLKYDEIKNELFNLLKQHKRQALSWDYIIALKREAKIVYVAGKRPRPFMPFIEMVPEPNKQ
jgi:peptidyl-prolyl cis-trans isomerase C